MSRSVIVCFNFTSARKFCVVVQIIVSICCKPNFCWFGTGIMGCESWSEIVILLVNAEWALQKRFTLWIDCCSGWQIRPLCFSFMQGWDRNRAALPRKAQRSAPKAYFSTPSTDATILKCHRHRHGTRHFIFLFCPLFCVAPLAFLLFMQAELVSTRALFRLSSVNEFFIPPLETCRSSWILCAKLKSGHAWRYK